MNENETTQTNPINIEPGTITLFLHLPIGVAKDLLEKVAAGRAPTPSSALLDELYTGACVGTGPRPEAEIEACLSRIETRLETPERLSDIRAKLAQPASPQPKPEITLEQVDKLASVITKSQDEFTQRLEALTEKIETKPQPKKATSMPATWDAMNDDQKVTYIRSVVSKPVGKKALKNWMTTSRLHFKEFNGPTKTALENVKSVLGPYPYSQRDGRIQEIKDILEDEKISIKDGAK